MNENLQNAIAEILTGVAATAQQLGEVAKEQYPLVVREYLSWGYALAIQHALIGITVGALLWWSSRWVLRSALAMEDPSEIGTLSFFATVLRILAIAFLVIYTASEGVMPATKIYLAPRVYLLEKVAALR